MNSIRVLVTDGSYKHTLGIIRSLGELYEVFVLSFRRNSLSSYSSYCKGEFVINSYDEPGSTELINSILADFSISIIIPVGSGSVKFFSDNRSKLPDQVRILLPDKNALEVSLSKSKSADLAKQLGIPSPKTYEIKAIEELESLKDTLSYPCVIKAPVEMGGNYVSYADSPDKLLKKYLGLLKRYPDEKGLPIIQEYIDGYGCGFFALYLDGKCGPVFMHRRTREFPPSGGFSTAAESIDNPLIEDYGRRILDNLNWNGIAMVEFKMSGEGIPYFIEINPKFWGSTELAISSGVSFPAELVKAILDGRVNYSKDYIVGKRYHWPVNGDIAHVFMRPGSIPGLLKDVFSSGTESNLHFRSDMKASMVLIVRGFIEILVYILKNLGFGKRKL